MQFCKIYASTKCTAKEGNSQASFMDQKLHTKKVFEISFPDEIYQFCSLEVLAQVDMTTRVHTLKKKKFRQKYFQGVWDPTKKALYVFSIANFVASLLNDFKWSKITPNESLYVWKISWSHLNSFKIIWSHVSHEATKVVILPKNERKNLTLLLWYLKLNCFRSIFGRIQDTKQSFRNWLTFRQQPESREQRLPFYCQLEFYDAMNKC